MPTIHCPNCNQTYEVDENVIGEKVECAVCNTSFTAQEIKTAEPIRLQMSPQGQDEGTTSNASVSELLSATPSQPRFDKKLIAIISACCAVIIILLIAVIVLLAQRGTGGTIAYSNQPVGPLPAGTPSELLLKYTEMGETPYVAEVLKQNPSFEVDRPRAEENKTALYLASEKGYEDIANLLLKRKADATICDSETDKKYSPLTIAAKNGHLAIVKTLLKSGIKIESRDGENRTPLYAAAANNQTEVVEFLCKSKANVNTYGRNGWTPLTVAANNGHVEVIKVLLKNDADLEMVRKYEKGDSTAVYIATVENYPDIVEILCKAGAKVNVYGLDGWTPLTAAACNGYTDIVNLLLTYGKGIDLEMVKKDEKGDFTALYQASVKNHPDIVEILCKAGAKVNVYGINGWTPLTVAANDGYTEVVNALLKYGKGIDLEMRNQTSLGGDTPLYHAVKNNHPETLEILCKNGADPSSYSGFMAQTPLIAAVQGGYIDVIKVLLKYGADINQKKNQYNDSAIETAQKNKRQDIVDLLRNPPRLEQNDIPRSVSTGNLKTIHEYVMKSINAVQNGNYGSDSDLFISRLRSARSNIQQQMVTQNVPNDYRNAVLGMLDTQINSLSSIRSLSQSPNYRNVSTEKRQELALQFITENVNAYKDLNKVLRKYGLKEIDDASGKF